LNTFLSTSIIALLLFFSNLSIAQTVHSYPNKPIRVIVGIAAGGATDLQARWFAQTLSTSLGRPFVIDNRSGAGGIIASQIASAAEPDGYTLLVATPAITIAPALHPHGTIHPAKDMAPISLITKSPFFVVVRTSFNVKTMIELIEYAKQRPDQLLVGAPTGTSIHLGVIWFAQASQTRLTIVTYKGNAPVFTDLIAGQINASMANGVSVFPLLKSGKLRALAVTSIERSTVMPDLPTVAESGVPFYDVNTWHGWLAPKNTNRSIILRLNAELSKAVKSTDLSEKLTKDAAIVIASTPEIFSHHLVNEIQRWKMLSKKIQPE